MSGFDTTPDPFFLRAMQKQKWTAAGALSELVDNSFGSGRGAAQRVHITHDTKNRTLTVLDNGEGMEAIGRLFQLGNTIGRSPGDIGMNGSGGTMAILWLSRKVSVWTLRDGRVNFDSVTWADCIAKKAFPVVSDQWRVASIANVPPDLLDAGHGTLIKIYLASERKISASNIKRDLAKTYAPGLRHNKEILWTTIGKGGDTDVLSDPLLLPDEGENTVAIDVTVKVGDEYLPVVGRIGRIPDLPQSQSQVTIGFGPRVIARTRECYASVDGTERFAGTGIGGWLDLGDDWLPYLATFKDAMNDQPAWDVLMDFVFQEIKPLLQEAERDQLTVEMEDLAIMLEAALDGKAHVEVESAGKKQRDDDDTERIGQGETDNPVEHKPSTPATLEPIDDAGNETTEQSAVTRLGIVPLSDEDMEQGLCRVDVDGTYVAVFVNQDHNLIQTAMEAKPVNRDLLHMLIVAHFAMAIAEDELLLARIFPPRAMRNLNDREGPDRVGLIVRMLIDRIRRQAA